MAIELDHQISGGREFKSRQQHLAKFATDT